MKQRLFRSQLLKGDMTDFSNCTQHISQCQHLEIGKKFAQQIEILMQKFDQRLTLSQEKNLQFKLVEDSFSMGPEVPLQTIAVGDDRIASFVCVQD